MDGADEVGQGETGQSASESASESADGSASESATSGAEEAESSTSTGDGDAGTTTAGNDDMTTATADGSTDNGNTATGDGESSTTSEGDTMSDDAMATSEGAGEWCGDGIVSVSESCDDGNDVDDDACSNACASNLAAQCKEPYNILDLADRNKTFNDGDGKVEWCDRLNGGGHDPQWIGDGWYRFMGDAGTHMPDAPPNAQSCGAEAPGWLLTEHPVIIDGVVQRTACFSWSNDSCQWETDIEVVDCDDFYLYHLVNTTTCALRYCGTD